MQKSGKIKEIGCPNCFKHLMGITDSEGGLKIVCNRCGVRLYSKQITPKTYIVKVTEP